jgi:hypothetical protein
MGLYYANLDAETRRLMIEEINFDVAAKGIYFSNYLSPDGARRWPELLVKAIHAGTDDTLAHSLVGCFKTLTERRTKHGITMVRVPVTAPQTLAEAQFNMYYIRALCQRALAAGGRIVVYRAKHVDVPRSVSEAMIGTELNPAIVLLALRETKGVEPPTNVPMPNTGITVRLEPL